MAVIAFPTKIARVPVTGTDLLSALEAISQSLKTNAALERLILQSDLPDSSKCKLLEPVMQATAKLFAANMTATGLLMHESGTP